MEEKGGRTEFGTMQATELAMTLDLAELRPSMKLSPYFVTTHIRTQKNDSKS
jgi:hypothetical protein